MNLKPIKNLVITAVCALLVSACQPEPKEQHTSLLAFGTLVDITLWGANKNLSQRVFQQVETDLKFMHYAWHAWQHGPMGRINELLSLTADFSANPSVLGVIGKAQELSLASDHLFNPSIGHLIELWGYHNDDPPHGPPPDQESIRKLLKQKPRMSDIEINKVRMKSRNAAVKLDLGAVAKGYALDQIINTIQHMGIKNAIINAGGDIKAIGRHGDRAWQIGIRHPRKEGVLAGVELQDGESIFTSGDYERYYEHQGQRYHHIIDGRTGYPAQSVTSVTVIHPDAATADAAATALFIAGANDWHRIAKKMGLKFVMLVNTRGEVHINPAMRKRLNFTESDLTFHISEPL